MDDKNAMVPTGRTELIPEMRNVETLSKHLLASGMFPNARKLEGVITIIEYGRELGIPPVAALNTMAIINGRLTMEAKAMLAVAANAGITWKVDKLDDKGCTMTFMRKDFAPCQVSFLEEEAKAAGLLGKGAWVSYKQDMYFARCASRGVRRIAPDVVLGLYSSEEMRDVGEAARKDMEGGARPETTNPAPAKTEPCVPGPAKPDPEVDIVAEAEAVDAEAVEDDSPPADQPAEDFPSDPEPEETKVDEAFEKAIDEIKFTLEKEKLPLNEFKEWLLKQGPKMRRKFVGKVGRGLSFHHGEPEDVKRLVFMLDKAILLFRKETQK